MFGIFKRKDKRSVEQVIFDIAEHQRDLDLFRMHELLQERELFIPVKPDSLPENLTSGSRIVTDSSHQIQITHAKGPNNEVMIPAVTMENHPVLQDGYIAMDWFEFLSMVVRIPEAWGVIIQGETSYVGLDKQRIQVFLSLQRT